MTKSTEFELTFYAEVTKPEGYEQAKSVVHHEQWEYKVEAGEGQPSPGKERVRSYTTDEKTYSYEACIKLNIPGDDGLVRCQEIPVAINQDYFEAWKKLFGTIGSKKVRYTYLSQNVELDVKGEKVELPEVNYEVDVLVNEQGQRSRWVKVDIELDKILEALKDRFPDLGPMDVTVKLSSLPLGLEGAFPSHSEDQAHQDTIRRFWDGFGHKLKEPVQPEEEVVEDPSKETPESSTSEGE